MSGADTNLAHKINPEEGINVNTHNEYPFAAELKAQREANLANEETPVLDSSSS